MRKRYSYGEQGEPRQEQDTQGVEAESLENPDYGGQDQDDDQNLHPMPAHGQSSKGRIAPQQLLLAVCALPLPLSSILYFDGLVG
jgi:hypothetical protein